MIRILQSVSNMDRGGIETMLMNYYRHLDRDQFQFDFLVNKEKPGFFDDEVRSLGGRIFMGPGLSPLKYPEYLRYMKTLLDREKEIKVLHAHNEAMEFYALSGAKKAGFPGKYGDIDGGLSELLQYYDISRHDFSEPFSPAVIRCTVGGANRPTSIQGGMNHVVLLLQERQRRVQPRRGQRQYPHRSEPARVHPGEKCLRFSFEPGAAGG